MRSTLFSRNKPFVDTPQRVACFVHTKKDGKYL